MTPDQKHFLIDIFRVVLRQGIPILGEFADRALFRNRDQKELYKTLFEGDTAASEHAREQLAGIVSEELEEHPELRDVDRFKEELFLANKSMFQELLHKAGLSAESANPEVRAFQKSLQGEEIRTSLVKTELEQRIQSLPNEIARHIISSGQVEDLYDLKEVVGRGGFSTVYRVVRKSNGAERALKLYTKGQDEKHLLRFLLGGYVGKYHLGSAKHLLVAYDFGGFLNNRMFFIEYPLLQGKNLEDWLLHLGTEVKVSHLHLHIAQQMAEGIAELHSHGFIHRDIKPSNFFLTTDSNVKLLDYGLIKALEQSLVSPQEMTTGSLIMGSPYYQSPEQINPVSFGNPTKATDIYSLGASLYHLLSGQRLFQKHTDAFMLMNAHVHETPTSLKECNSSVPGWLDRLVLACLNKQPEERPPLQIVLESLQQASFENRTIIVEPVLKSKNKKSKEKKRRKKNSIDSSSNTTSTIQEEVEQKSLSSKAGKSETKRSKAGRYGCLLFLMFLMASFAVPAFLKFIRRSKSQEARRNIIGLGNAAVSYFQHVRSFPLSEDWICTPRAKPCSQGSPLYSSDPSRWNKSPWQELTFGINKEHFYQYCYKGSEKTFTIFARGNLDCDETQSTFRITGQYNSVSGQVKRSRMVVKNALE